MKDIKYTIMLFYKMTVQLEYIDHLLNFPQMLNIAINIILHLSVILTLCFMLSIACIMLKIMLA